MVTTLFKTATGSRKLERVGEYKNKKNKTGIMKKQSIVFLNIQILITLFLISCDSNIKTKENQNNIKKGDSQIIMSLVYQQKAAEYKALCLQAYNIAKKKVEEEVKKNSSKDPLAVITDLDETALDNSANEVWLYNHDSAYTPSQFADWCRLTKAKSVPGSVPFFNYVNNQTDSKKRKIDIFYISNRDSSLIDVTIKNMKELGFPQLERSHFLFQSKTTTSSKESRRELVRKNHTVVILLGDNLIDLDSSFDKKTTDVRNNEVDRLNEKWGDKYIVFPNSTYGDWENFLYHDFISKNNGSWPNLNQEDSIRLSNLYAY